MKTKITLIFAIFAALSFILSVLAICMSLHVISIGSMEFLGGTIAILAMIVVVLMGWHIFNILDLKEYRKALSKVDSLEASIVQLNSRLEIQTHNLAEASGEINVTKKSTENLDKKVSVLEKDIKRLERKIDDLEDTFERRIAEYLKKKSNSDNYLKTLH